MNDYAERIGRAAEPYLRDLKRDMDGGGDPAGALRRIARHLAPMSRMDHMDPAERDAIYRLLEAAAVGAMLNEPRPIRVSVGAANLLLQTVQAARQEVYRRTLERSRYGGGRDHEADVYETTLGLVSRLLEQEVRRVREAAAKGLTAENVAALDAFDDRLGVSVT